MNKLHPVTAFSYYAGTLAMLILFQHPVFLMGGFGLILAVNYAEGSFRALRSWLFFMFSTGLVIFAANPVFNERGRTVLFGLGNHRITMEAVLLGGMSAIMIMGIIALFVSYNEILTPNKILFLFSKIMPQFAVLLMLTLRFIPLMKRRLGEISVVQSSKGVYIASGKLKDRIKNGMLYIQALLVFSLEEAIQTADSMKARAYGSGKRSSYDHFKFRKMDWISLSVLFVLFFYTVSGRMSGLGVLEVYPVMESFSLEPEEAAVLIAFWVFIGFPLILKLKGVFKWRRSN